MATNLENMENLEKSGNLKNCQNLRENSGKIEFLQKKPGKLRENEKYVTRLPTKMHSIEFSCLELQGKILQCPGNLSENVATLKAVP